MWQEDKRCVKVLLKVRISTNNRQDAERNLEIDLSVIEQLENEFHYYDLDHSMSGSTELKPGEGWISMIKDNSFSRDYSVYCVAKNPMYIEGVPYYAEMSITINIQKNNRTGELVRVAVSNPDTRF